MKLIAVSLFSQNYSLCCMRHKKEAGSFSQFGRSCFYRLLKRLSSKGQLLVLLQLIAYGDGAAQPANYFRNPLDIPITLSANFAEIRTNHFHSGFDIRTNGETGYKVYAAADGVVSRIKVSAGGFGNVLYISHPNGYMTVYAHLDRFADAIATYVRQQQYAKQSFEIELFPDASKFAFKKGELIAYSGNSGSSGGPHLHFEIRDASGETYPLNPASFYSLKDTIAPKITAAYLYNLQNSMADPVKYTLQKGKSGYRINGDTITVDQQVVGIALEAADYMNNTSNDYGMYEYRVLLDGRQIYGVTFDRMDFANGRYVNAFIDFRILKATGKKIQRLYRLPGDRNNIYHELENDGKIGLSDGAFHKVEVLATDAYENSSRLTFFIKSTLKENTTTAAAGKGTVFRYQQANSFASDSIRLNLPANILYEDINFQYVAKTGDTKRYSATHLVHNTATPVHDSYTISILPRNIPPALQSKALIVYDDGTGIKSTKTSHWEGKWLAARAREFGYFYVLLDTVAPKIICENVKQNQLITSNTIRFTITDKLSGIVSYKGLLDEKWILMEYDAKNDRLQCTLDKQMAPGEHTLRLLVSDDVKNESIYLLKFKK